MSKILKKRANKKQPYNIIENSLIYKPVDIPCLHGAFCDMIIMVWGRFMYKFCREGHLSFQIVEVKPKVTLIGLLIKSKILTLPSKQ